MRSWGAEILGHEESNIRLDRLRASAPVLLNHDSDELIGVIEKCWIEEKKLYCEVKFSRNEDAQEVYTDIVDGIRKNVSIGYVIHKLADMGNDQYRVIDWEPYEISMVSMPADYTVGIGRSAEPEEEEKIEPEIININIKEIPNMQTEEQIRQAEADRKNEIEALGKKHNVPFDWAVKSNVSIEQFRGYVLDQIGSSKPIFTEENSVDFSKKEKKEYSLSNAVKSLIDGKKSFEREVSDEIAKKQGRTPEGLYIPLNAFAFKRDLTGGGSGTGDDFAGVDYKADMFLDVLRAKQVLTPAGAITLSGLKGQVQLPKLSGGTTAYWPGETGSVTESNPTTDQIVLSPKKVGAFVDVAKMLLHESPLALESIISNELISRIGLSIENKAIEGAGTNEPTGISITTGVNSVSTASATWAKMLEFASEIESDNAQGSNMVYVTTPAIASALMSRAKVGNYPVFIHENGQIGGYPVFKTTNMTAGTIVFGDFSNLMMGLWGAMELLVDPYTLAQTGLNRIILNTFADAACKYPEAFSYSSDFS